MLCWQVQLDDYKERETRIDPGKIAWESNLILQIRQAAPTFLDYFSGGCDLKISVAIDFTGSNGHPNQSSSLHYIKGDAPNCYQRALTSVLDVLKAYDDGDSVHLMGFGGLQVCLHIRSCIYVYVCGM